MKLSPTEREIMDFNESVEAMDYLLRHEICANLGIKFLLFFRK